MNVGQLEWDAIIKDSKFMAQMSNMESRLNSFADNVEKRGEGLEDFFKRAAVSAAGFFSVQASANFLRSIIETRGEFQQLEIAFSTMLKSKEKADSLMKDIANFAATTPFDLKQVAAGTKQLLAYGFAAEDMKENLSMLGNVASGVGSQISDLIYLYGTLKASGRVTQMDINQFAGRGIPIYEELSKVLKINVEQVRDFVSAGKIGFKEIEASFKNMTGVGGMFNNLMQAQSKSLTGQISNLQDAWASMLNEMGRSQEGLFSQGIEGVALLVENYDTVLTILKSLIAVYGAYRAAIILNTVAINVHTVATSGATAADILHNAALVIKERLLTLTTSKYIAAQAAIAAYTAVILALSAVIYSFVQYQNAAEIAEESLADARRKGSLAAKDEADRIQDLTKIIKDHTANKEDQDKAYKELHATAGKAIESYSLEEIAAGNADKALKEYVTTIGNAKAAEVEYANYKALEDKLRAIKEEGIKAITVWDKLQISLSNTFAPKWWTKEGLNSWWDQLFSSDVANEQIVNQEIKKIEDAQKKILDGVNGKGVKDLLNPASTGINTPGSTDVVQNKKYWENEKQKAQDELEALSVIEAKGKQGQDLLRKIAEYDEKLSLYSNKKSTKGESDLQKLLSDLNDAERNVKQKNLSKDESELDKINEFYDKLEARAKAIKAEAGILQRIANSRQAETGIEKEKIDTENLKKEVEKQKEIFENFESFKLETSDHYAQLRYGSQKAEFESFEKYLESIQEELYSSASERGLTGEETNRLKFVNDELDKFRKEKDKKEAQSFASALKLAETYEVNKANIVKKYNDARAALGTNASQSELDNLKRLQRDEEDVLSRSLIEQLDSFKFFFENLAELSGKRLTGATEALEKDLNELVAKYPELKRFADLLITKIAGAKTAKTADDFRDMSDSLSFMADALQDIGGGLSDSLRTASDLAGQVSNMKLDMQAFAEATKNGSSIGQISSGLGIIGAGFNIMNSLNNFLDRSTAADAQRLHNSEMQLQATEGMTKALERQIKIAQDAYGTEKVEEYTKAIENANKTIDESGKILKGRYSFTGDAELDRVIDKMNKGEKLKGFSLWGDSEKDLARIIKQGKTLTTDVESLQRLLDSGKLDSQTAQIAQNFINAHDAIKDSENAIIAFQTGIDFDTLSDNLIDAISSGDNAIEALGKNFEDTMKDAILNSLKDGAYKEQMQKFYEDFNKASKDGFTENEIDKLRFEYEKIAKERADKLTEFEKVSGIDFSKDASKSSGIIGAFERTVTESSANEWIGLGRATYELEKNHYMEAQKQSLQAQKYISIAEKNLDIAVKIEKNTSDTVVELKNAVGYLTTISNNSKANQSDRDLGL